MPAAPSITSLLSPDFIARLDRLDILSRKVLQGKIKGERRSKKRGQSVEFADYRPYVVGDDLRFIDWNLYARLDKLFLKLFMEEEDLAVSVLIDESASMRYGDPDKLTYARKLAAALGYIALANHNRLHLFKFTDTLSSALINQRGRRPIPQMIQFLMQDMVESAGTKTPKVGQHFKDADLRQGDLTAACRRFAMMGQNKGVVLLISDFFDKGELADALRYLSGDRFDVYVIHLLAPQEVDPAKAGLVGDLKLIDLEDDNEAEVSVSTPLLNRYKANLQAYCLHLKEECSKRNMVYLMTDTSISFDTLILRYLREKGLLG
jgi:uncharacterized protein (DUF58 family)